MNALFDDHALQFPSTPRSPFCYNMYGVTNFARTEISGSFSYMHKINMASRSRRSDGKPCRPRSSYNFFFQEQIHKVATVMLRETGKKASYAELSSVIAKQWKKVDRQTKAHYQHLAIKDKRRYGIEIVQWRIEQEGNEGEYGSHENKAKKKSKGKSKNDANAVDKCTTQPTAGCKQQDPVQASPLASPASLDTPSTMVNMDSRASQQALSEMELPSAPHEDPLEPIDIFQACPFQPMPFSTPVHAAGPVERDVVPHISEFDMDDATFLQELYGYGTD